MKKVLLAILIMYANTASANEENKFNYTIGALSLYSETYKTSHEHIIRAFPQVGVSYNNLFFNVRHGAGIYLYRTKPWTIRLSLGYNLGRKGSDIAHLKNTIADSDKGLDALFGVRYQFRFFGINYNYARQVTGKYTGSRSRIAIASGLPIGGGRFMLVSISTTYYDKDHIQELYGINKQQAQKSNIAQYHADAAFTYIGLNINAFQPITMYWRAMLFISYQQYINDAKASPITLHNDSYSVGLGVSYSTQQRRR